MIESDDRFTVDITACSSSGWEIKVRPVWQPEHQEYFYRKYGIDDIGYTCFGSRERAERKAHRMVRKICRARSMERRSGATYTAECE